MQILVSRDENKNKSKWYSARVFNVFSYFDIYICDYLSIFLSNHNSQKHI